MSYTTIVLGIYLAFGVLELLAGRFFQKTAHAGDRWIEGVGSLVLLGITVPSVFWMSGAGVEALAPGSEGAWAGLPIWAMALLLVVGDDMTQYWWHRASHQFAWLNRLHRAHHSAGYMSVRLVYRNNLFFYLFMPAIWVSGALIYLGLGPAYAVYVVIKQTVVIAAHSSVRWDEWLYRQPGLSWIAWIAERTVSTPSTHSAHHGKHKDDGVTHYKGNYGNLLFFWDVLFGTAHISRRYPTSYGLEDIADESWQNELAWPVVRPKATTSPGMLPAGARN